MTAEELAGAYLRALGEADLRAMLGLFAEDALVHSPLYGPVPAASFFPALFSDTAESRLTLRGVMQGRTIDGKPLASVWFSFDWLLSSGRQVHFDVVDLLELAADQRIASLRIVYDTADIRPVFERETGRASWRENRDDGSAEQ